MNLFEEEVNVAKKIFDLNEVVEFQMKHEVQIIRGEDCMYMCYINRKVFAVSLTMFSALIIGIKAFKKQLNNQ